MQVSPMPIVFERKIFLSSRSLRVNVPEEIAKALNLKAGDTVAISLTDSQMVVEKARKK
jgi:bifunctional DNA-binding transcriptional regulator/antitoxin component of YhaV-PrlF toxin-antitoxin module